MADKEDSFKIPLSRREHERVAHAAKNLGLSASEYATEVVRGRVQEDRARLKHWHNSRSEKHEEICSEIFRALLGEQLLKARKLDITLFVFDFGDAGHVAFNGSLPLPQARETIKTAIAKLRRASAQENPEVILTTREDEPISPLSYDEMIALRERVKGMLPDGLGFACIVGKGEGLTYVSNAERSAVIQMLEDDVLPGWAGRMVEESQRALEFTEGLRDEAREELVDLMPAELRAQVLEAEKRIAHLVLPPPTSPANVETLMMAWAYLYAPIAARVPLSEDGLSAVLGACAASKKLWELNRKFLVFGEAAFMHAPFLEFACLWLESAYARLEVGHKLAASLCLTDVPEDIEVRAPWAAWSLVLPDGLFGDGRVIGPDGVNPGAIARLWIVGTRVTHFLTNQGAVIGGSDAESLNDSVGLPQGLVVQNLIRGACLALSNPEEFKKKQSGASSSKGKRSRDVGAPSMEQARFMLSAPVTVDFREHLSEMLSGRTHSSPKAQFLVRGHWRSQAHGPKHSLRKTLWIAPFWKGDPEAIVLLRQHKAEL